MSNIDFVKNIAIADFDYPLPDEMIARHPLADRDRCRLLYLPAGSLVPQDLKFNDLPSLLPADSLLVCNDTRVINARIKVRKQTGSEIEIFLLEPLDPVDYVLTFQSRGRCVWSCLVGNLKRWKSGTLQKPLMIRDREVILNITRGEARPGNAHAIEFNWDDPDITFADVVEAAGYIPIPPYLKRESESSDADDYQTVYARVKGSVAAPTAGLHFTDALFDSLAAKGIRKTPLTLHVGAGTFQPVKSENIGDHPMHTEVFSISRDTLDALIDARKTGTPVTAVGTTSVRTLESLPYLGMRLSEGDTSLYVDQWDPYRGVITDSSEDAESTVRLLSSIRAYMAQNGVDSLTASTSIMIAPGFEWRIVDNIVTNFHQPQSTLLLLVSSFLGRDVEGAERWRSVYDHALQAGYRFLSYGDACLFRR